MKDKKNMFETRPYKQLQGKIFTSLSTPLLLALLLLPTMLLFYKDSAIAQTGQAPAMLGKSLASHYPQQPQAFSATGEEYAINPAMFAATPRHDQSVELALRIRDIANELLASITEPEYQRARLQGGILVLSFVDQRRLARTSSLGRYLAEQLMTELQQKGLPVVELRRSNEVVIGENGEFALSRNPKEIKQEQHAVAMVLGTYTITPDKVLVNARIIDNHSSRLLAATTSLIPRNEVVDTLLSDATDSQASRPTEPMYLKRLEM